MRTPRPRTIGRPTRGTRDDAQVEVGVVRACAFLTMEDLTGYASDDQLAVEAFSDRDWRVDLVPWTANVHWSRYEAVLIRSTWNYHKHADRFVAALEHIDDETRLFNRLQIVRWNIRKTYLKDLSDRGVEVVPTTFGHGLTANQVDALFSWSGTDRVVVKPVVSAGADSTFLLRRDTLSDRETAAEAFRDAEYMVQPFVTSVLDEGEYSLFYFDGVFSHCVVKTPKLQDFRVQEEHGGTVLPTEAPVDLQVAAQRAEKAVDLRPLYARVDLVRGVSGTWLVMELELIEPSLYLRTDAEAAARFAQAFDARMCRADL